MYAWLDSTGQMWSVYHCLSSCLWGYTEVPIAGGWWFSRDGSISDYGLTLMDNCLHARVGAVGYRGAGLGVKG